MDVLNIYWVNQASGLPDQPAGRRHFDMGSVLADRGSQVTLVASDLSLLERQYSRRKSHWDLRPRREVVRGVGVVWLSAGRYERNDWRRLFSMMVFSAGVFTFLVTRKRTVGTVIVGSSPHLFGAFGAWAAAWVRGIPFVLEIRDLWPESYTALTGKTSGGLFRLMRWMADWLYGRASAIVVLAEGSKDVVVSRGVRAEEVFCIPNGVDIERFDRKPHVGKRATVTFAYTGAHGPANGLDVLLRACALLQSAGREDITVALVGDGPVKEKLGALSRDMGLRNVTFRAAVPSEEIPAFLASVDAGLMLLAPAELFSYGVSPNKLFEYLAAGLPVVNNVPGMVAKLIEDASAGETCAPGDSEALAETMICIARDIREGTGRYRGGRRFVERHYNRRVLAVDFEQVLRDSVGQGN